MDFSTGRELLQAADSSQDTAPFFGFIGAAAALVFSCESRQSRPIGFFCVWLLLPSLAACLLAIVTRYCHGRRVISSSFARACCDCRPTRSLLSIVLVPLLFTVPCRHGSCLWNSKVRCWHCIHGCDEA